MAIFNSYVKLPEGIIFGEAMENRDSESIQSESWEPQDPTCKVDAGRPVARRSEQFGGKITMVLAPVVDFSGIFHGFSGDILNLSQFPKPSKIAP